MKIPVTLLFSLPIALRAAVVAADRPGSNDGVVGYAVQRRQYAQSSRRLAVHRKRSSSVFSALDFNDKWVFSGGYFIDVEIGTPPQKLEVLLDTGSSDLFVPSSAASECLGNRCPGGSFDEHASATFDKVEDSPLFHTRYLDGSTANGTYARDTLRIGKATLEDHTFAVAHEIQVSPFQEEGTGAQYGIAGLSFVGQEASACTSSPEDCNLDFTTPTILDSLYSAGYIRSRSFSLFLHDIDAGKGNILFGGIDNAKYDGDLVALSIQKDMENDQGAHGAYVGQKLLLTSVSSTIEGTTAQYTRSHYQSSVIIDSGAGSLGLPPHVYDQVIASSPILQQYEGSSAMLCKYADLDAHLTLGLTGANGASTHINVPFSNLVVPVYEGTYDNSRPYLHHGEELCVFAISRGTQTNNVLGDPLLRSTYAVFNLDEKTISFAQANYDATRSDVHAIDSGRASKMTDQKPVGNG